jgi:hypothetical protein
MKALGNPPVNVRLAMEPVIAMISDKPKKYEWTDIKVWLKKDNFISLVMNFDKDSISPSVKAFIKKNYLDKKDEFVIDNIMRASKAAGPLALWM